MSIDTEGRTYRLISCALRNSGTGWQAITDTGHQPTGITDVVTQPDYLEILHPVGGTTVSSLQVTVDETYAAQGLRVGASVGVDYSRIYLYDQPADHITDQISWDGSAWQSKAGVYSISAAGAVLTLTHPDMGAGGSVAIGNRGSNLIQAGAFTPTTTQVAVYTGAYGALAAAPTPSTATRAYVTRYGQRAVPPADPASVMSATGNLWITGLIEVPCGCS